MSLSCNTQNSIFFKRHILVYLAFLDSNNKCFFQQFCWERKLSECGINLVDHEGKLIKCSILFRILCKALIDSLLNLCCNYRGFSKKPCFKNTKSIVLASIGLYMYSNIADEWHSATSAKSGNAFYLWLTQEVSHVNALYK